MDESRSSLHRLGIHLLSIYRQLYIGKLHTAANAVPLIKATKQRAPPVEAAGAPIIGGFAFLILIAAGVLIVAVDAVTLQKSLDAIRLYLGLHRT